MMIGIKTRKVYHISESDSMYLEVAGSFFGSLEVAIKGRGNIYFIPVGGRKCKECGGICKVN